MAPRAVRPLAGWVGLVPFEVEHVAFGRLPRVPYVGGHAEVIVRLCSVDALGRRGVVFRALACSRLLPVLAARAALGLPSRWASARLSLDDDTMVVPVHVRRTGGPALHSVLSARIGEPLPHPGPLAAFLTARRGLHVDRHGRTLYLPSSIPRGRCTGPSSPSWPTTWWPTRASPRRRRRPASSTHGVCPCASAPRSSARRPAEAGPPRAQPAAPPSSRPFQ